tara:strand:- start:3467 stop:3919 length:453 start_codon:yes stop_codon:yes gene_type:complete
MAVTFTNNFKNILDKLESILESEFKGALPVYKGNSIPAGVNQAIQLTPTGSVLSEYNASSETREFSVQVRFIFNEANVNETALDHILRQVSRIEALIHDNVAMTLDKGSDADNSNAFNCRFESTELNADEESGVYVVLWEYKCQHLGNVG